MKKNIPFLYTKNDIILKKDNAAPFFLRGVNLGGWLMMEGYILFGKNIPAKSFKANMVKHHGQNGLEEFLYEFRNNFIGEEDFKLVKENGFNCIRLPFNSSILEENNGISYLDKAIDLCERYSIYCILDMHSAPGCQNKDWHGDSDGESRLWTDDRYQERFFEHWEMLSDRFKGREIVAGYNILNEPVIDDNSKDILRNFYKEAVKRIRKIDKDHIIFLEGNTWSQDLEAIGEPFGNNLSYSIHYYHPLDLTHNFGTSLKYPGHIQGEDWDKEKIKRYMGLYRDLSQKWKVPIFAGEFGVNPTYSRDKGCMEWLGDVLSIFNEFGFHWTYWTYKTIENNLFPAGIYRYNENPPWVNQEGSIKGWENFYFLWNKSKKGIVESWKTTNFQKDPSLFNLLAKYT
ncbi:MAG: glycoside hydrolase family 5 protein [Candidatus Omnitrophota bacterium]